MPDTRTDRLRPRTTGCRTPWRGSCRVTTGSGCFGFSAFGRSLRAATLAAEAMSNALSRRPTAPRVVLVPRSSYCPPLARF
jgi:hypothetical protein